MICHSSFQALLQPLPSMGLPLSCIVTPLNGVFRASNRTFRIYNFCSSTWSSAYSEKHQSSPSQMSLLRGGSHRPLTRAAAKNDRNLNQTQVGIPHHASRFSSSASVTFQQFKNSSFTDSGSLYLELQCECLGHFSLFLTSIAEIC